DQVLMVAAREVRAADRALEQHVSDDRELARPVKEHDVARRVAGAVDDLERKLADGYRIAVLQPAIGLEAARGHAPFASVVVEARNPEPVLLVRTLDRQAEFLGQHAGLPAVVEMAVGDEQLLQRHARLGDASLELVEIAAWVNQRAPHRLRAP